MRNVIDNYAQSWTALFRAFSSHRQPSASLTKLFPSWTRLLAELDKVEVVMISQESTTKDVKIVGIDNYNNKLQAGLNISIHISHIHLQQYYVKFFRRKPVPPGLTLTGYCPVIRRVARNSQWGAKPPAAGGTGVRARSPQRSKILRFFAK